MGLSDVFFSNLPQHFIAWRKCSQSVKHKQVEKKNIKTPRMQIFIIFFLISIPCLKNRTCCLCLLHLCKGLAPLSLFLQAADIWGNCAGYSSAQGEYDRVPGLPCDTHPDFQKLALALPCSRKLGCGLSLMLPTWCQEYWPGKQEDGSTPGSRVVFQYQLKRTQTKKKILRCSSNWGIQFSQFSLLILCRRLGWRMQMQFLIGSYSPLQNKSTIYIGLFIYI